jgi:hypothetical protein
VASGVPRKAIEYGVRRVPGLRRIPIFKLLVVAEVAILAHRHVTRLDSVERGRLFKLVTRGRGRPSRLSDEEREELQQLVAKMEPRLFAGLAADKLSPVPLPRRLVHGKRRG